MCFLVPYVHTPPWASKPYWSLPKDKPPHDSGAVGGGWRKPRMTACEAERWQHSGEGGSDCEGRLLRLGSNPSQITLIQTSQTCSVFWVICGICKQACKQVKADVFLTRENLTKVKKKKKKVSSCIVFPTAGVSVPAEGQLIKWRCCPSYRADLGDLEASSRGRDPWGGWEFGHRGERWWLEEGGGATDTSQG